MNIDAITVRSSKIMIDFRYLEYRILCIYWLLLQEWPANVRIFKVYSDIYGSEQKPAIPDVPE